MKLLMLQDYSANNECVMKATLQNHLKYCKKWGIDCQYINKPYSPHNNFHCLQNFMSVYDRIITVGTDILFTNMEKDIRDFCSDHFIVVQEQGPLCKGQKVLNGDFIIWNSNYKQKLLQMAELDKKYRHTQAAMGALYKDEHWKNFFDVLPVRTLQSMCPWEKKELQKFFWQEGDFSVHCFKCGTRPDIKDKMLLIEGFKKEHPQVV